MNIKKRWFQLFGKSEITNALWSDLEKQYSSKKRKYHNLNHLSFMLQKLDELFPKYKNNKSLNFAIYLHDYYYSIFSRDNEKKSAKLAKEKAKEVGLNKNECNLIYELILLSEGHEFSGQKEIHNIFLDLDLCILAENADEYLAYASSIKQEYHLIPKLLYKMKRKEFLEKLLSRQFLFKTKEMDRFESRARRNIQCEIDLNFDFKEYELRHLIPIEIQDKKIVREYSQIQFRVEIDFEKIEKVFSYKLDRMTYDEIFLEIIYENGKSILISESAPNFADFSIELCKKIENCKPFEHWYFEVMFPAFELSLTEVYGSFEK